MDRFGEKAHRQWMKNDSRENRENILKRKRVTQQEGNLMDKNKLRAVIVELAQMNVELDKRGGPAKDGKLFEKIIEMQDDLLEAFGLPGTMYYQELLFFRSVPWEAEVDKLIMLLQKESDIQKNKPKKTELEILIEAKEGKRDPMNILPRIGISTHEYTLFVYDVILMKDIDSPENVLAELKKTNTGDMLGTLGRMGDCRYYLNKRKIKTMLKQASDDEKLNIYIQMLEKEGVNTDLLKNAEEKISFFEKNGLQYVRYYATYIIDSIHEFIKEQSCGI